MMVKRAKSGEITNLSESKGREVTAGVAPDLEWAPVIKDVLDVPVNPQHDISIDLDEEDTDEIAVRV